MRKNIADHRQITEALANAYIVGHRPDFAALQPVSAWTATAGATQSLRFAVPPGDDGVHARRVNLVVVDAATGAPLQALSLGCR